MKTFLRRTAVVLTAIILAAASAVTASAAGPLVTSDDYGQINSCRIVYNKSVKRKSQKLPMLRRDRSLEKIAAIRAREIAETGIFSHTRPNGRRGISLIKGRRAKGENIARGQSSFAEASSAWYASPSHRANMLRKKFRKVGIAAYSFNGVTCWVEIFSS